MAAADRSGDGYRGKAGCDLLKRGNASRPGPCCIIVVVVASAVAGAAAGAAAMAVNIVSDRRGLPAP